MLQVFTADQTCVNLSFKIKFDTILIYRYTDIQNKIKIAKLKTKIKICT